MLRFLLVLATACPVLAQDASPTIDPTVRTSGALASDAIENEITVDYDDLGVPTVRANDRGDAYFAQGYLHAQNRFTQMDVTRRMAAGEISAMVGRAALGQDMRMRPLRLRSVAEACAANLPEGERALLQKYADGVNLGLSDLKVPPPEYAIIQTSPKAWTVADTFLVVLAFSTLLDSSGDLELRNAAMFESLPEEVREYVYNPVSRFDATIPGLERRKPSIPRIPTRDVISLRDLPDQPPVIEYRYDMDDDDGPGGGPGGAPGDGDAEDGAVDVEEEKNEDAGDNKRNDVRSRFETERTNPGSNNWAVSGRLTRDGRAILASDPHLQLQLPGSWYRIRMEWPDHDLVGLSIPGIPGIVMGSNGHVAWGFTNLTGDLQDIIALEIDPEDPNRYRTADGWKPFGAIKERIEILGEDPFELDLKTTQWGVVNATYRDKNGIERSGVREWAALNPELVNLNSLKVEDARTLEEALDVLASWNGPPQNAVVADSEGNVGFTVTGFLPDRGRKDGRAPYGLWDGTPSWTTRDPIEPPRLSGEDVDYVFTANNRTVDQKQAKKLGYAWGHPARARRIRDVLATTTDADESSMLALQMDSTTVGLEPWRRLILEAVPADETDEQLAAAREAIVAWNSRADTDQVGITLLDDVRMRSLEDISAAVATWAGEEELGTFDEAYLHEEPYLRVIEDQPENWLPPGKAESWREWLRDQVRASVAEGNLRPWGEVNQITLRSPFADMAPAAMRGMLEIKSGPQSGYWNAPKVLMPGFGASARLVVSPSHEADGFLLTPGGQSGNPLSPHYRSLNASWIAGDPLPLLPGESVASFTLAPATDSD